MVEDWLELADAAILISFGRLVQKVARGYIQHSIEQSQFLILTVLPIEVLLRRELHVFELLEYLLVDSNAVEKY